MATRGPMTAEITLPAASPPASLALPFTVRDARREQLQREYEEAVARLRRVRQYRFVIYGEIRRCLHVLGDLAIDLVGADRYEALKKESERLSPDPAAPEPGEADEPAVDPALAWMEPEPATDPAEALPSLPPAPTSEETSHAARTLRECLEYLDAADRSTPEFHLAILQAEERLMEHERSARPAPALTESSAGGPVIEPASPASSPPTSS